MEENPERAGERAQEDHGGTGKEHPPSLRHLPVRELHVDVVEEVAGGTQQVGVAGRDHHARGRGQQQAAQGGGHDVGDREGEDRRVGVDDRQQDDGARGQEDHERNHHGTGEEADRGAPDALGILYRREPLVDVLAAEQEQEQRQEVPQELDDAKAPVPRGLLLRQPGEEPGEAAHLAQDPGQPDQERTEDEHRTDGVRVDYGDDPPDGRQEDDGEREDQGPQPRRDPGGYVEHVAAAGELVGSDADVGQEDAYAPGRPGQSPVADLQDLRHRVLGQPPNPVCQREVEEHDAYRGAREEEDGRQGSVLVDEARPAHDDPCTHEGGRQAAGRDCPGEAAPRSHGAVAALDPPPGEVQPHEEQHQVGHHYDELHGSSRLARTAEPLRDQSYNNGPLESMVARRNNAPI